MFVFVMFSYCRVLSGKSKFLTEFKNGLCLACEDLFEREEGCQELRKQNFLFGPASNPVCEFDVTSCIVGISSTVTKRKPSVNFLLLEGMYIK
jgi:hypothetical protein